MVAATIQSPLAEQIADVRDSFKSGDISDALSQLRVIYQKGNAIPGEQGEYLASLAEVAREGVDKGLVGNLGRSFSRKLRGFTGDLQYDVNQKFEDLQSATKSLLNRVTSGAVITNEAVPLIAGHVLAVKGLLESHSSLEIKIGAASALGQIAGSIEKNLDLSRVGAWESDVLSKELSDAAESIGRVQIGKREQLGEKDRSFLQGVNTKLRLLAHTTYKGLL